MPVRREKERKQIKKYCILLFSLYYNSTEELSLPFSISLHFGVFKQLCCQEENSMTVVILSNKKKSTCFRCKHVLVIHEPFCEPFDSTIVTVQDSKYFH